MNRVKELRERAGIQQKEVAVAAGVSRPTVSEWEHQKKDPSGDRLIKLAEFFGVSTGVVLGYDPMPGSSLDSELSPEDRELWELREAVRRDPDRLTLFKLAKDARPQDVRQAVAVLDALRASNPEFYDGDDPA